MKLGFVWKDIRDLLTRIIVDLKKLFVLEKKNNVVWPGGADLWHHSTILYFDRMPLKD